MVGRQRRPPPLQAAHGRRLFAGEPRLQEDDDRKHAEVHMGGQDAAEDVELVLDLARVQHVEDLRQSGQASASRKGMTLCADIGQRQALPHAQCSNTGMQDGPA